MLTKEQWLYLHEVCLDTVRGAIAGLAADKLAAQPFSNGQSVGAEVNHVIGAEIYWLREVKIEPAFREVALAGWSEAALVDELNKIQHQYQEILGARGLDSDVLFGLGRVSQHALHHYVSIVKLRKALEPGWKPPGWPAVGSWERAVDLISDLLIRGPEAKPRDA
jgi:hypothetical protein